MLLLGLVLYLGPFVIQVANSFKTDPDAVANPLSLIPDPFTTAAWKVALGRDPTVDSPVPRWIANSFFVTIVVTLGRVLLASLAGYALARLRFRGRGVVSAGLIAVMAVPGIVLLIPKFLVLNRLGIWDTYWAMTIPLFADAVGILLMKTAFEAVPIELEEAARIDGAGIFTRLVAGHAPADRSGVDHGDHHLVPGIVERVHLLPRGDAGSGPGDAEPRHRPPDGRQPRPGSAVPA